MITANHQTNAGQLVVDIYDFTAERRSPNQRETPFRCYPEPSDFVICATDNGVLMSVQNKALTADDPAVRIEEFDLAYGYTLELGNQKHEEACKKLWELTPESFHTTFAPECQFGDIQNRHSCTVVKLLGVCIQPEYFARTIGSFHHKGFKVGVQVIEMDVRKAPKYEESLTIKGLAIDIGDGRARALVAPIFLESEEARFDD